MTTEQAVAHFGGVKKLADALGISRAAVYQWGAHPPLDRQCQIEIVSGAAIRAAIARPAAPLAQYVRRDAQAPEVSE